MKAELYRTIKKNGTFGFYVIDGEVFGWTIEREWKDNTPFISCIPPGTYICKRVESNKYGETFEVVDVPGRTLIRFHWGSFPTDYEGCIGFGKKRVEVSDGYMLYSTQEKFDEFMARMSGIDEFELEVIDDQQTV